MVLSQFAGSSSPPHVVAVAAAGWQVRAGVGVVVAPVLGTALAAARQRGWGLRPVSRALRPGGWPGPAQPGSPRGVGGHEQARRTCAPSGGWWRRPRARGRRPCRAGVRRPLARARISSPRDYSGLHHARRGRHPVPVVLHQARQRREDPHPPGGLGQQPADLGWLLQGQLTVRCPRLCPALRDLAAGQHEHGIGQGDAQHRLQFARADGHARQARARAAPRRRPTRRRPLPTRAPESGGSGAG